MMPDVVIHCTQKLAKKLSDVSRQQLTAPGPLGSWHANLYHIDHRQCIMFCHDLTRFMLFMPGLKKNDFSSLDFWFKDLFANTMLTLGYEPALIEKAVLQVDQLKFDTACDRSVQGTMRSAKLQDLDAMIFDVPNVMDLPMYSTSARLCDRPVTTKDLKSTECLWPVREMQELLISM